MSSVILLSASYVPIPIVNHASSKYLLASSCLPQQFSFKNFESKSIMSKHTSYNSYQLFFYYISKFPILFSIKFLCFSHYPLLLVILLQFHISTASSWAYPVLRSTKALAKAILLQISSLASVHFWYPVHFWCVLLSSVLLLSKYQNCCFTCAVSWPSIPLIIFCYHHLYPQSSD